MHFMAKTLVRSRAHRIIWMAYIGFAIAVVANSSIIDGRLLTHHSKRGVQFLVLSGRWHPPSSSSTAFVM